MEEEGRLGAHLTQDAATQDAAPLSGQQGCIKSYREGMRTTVRLDDDVVAALERIRRDSGLGLSEALNRLARSGMVERPRPRAFKQRTVRLGLRIDVSDVADAIETLEGPSAR